MHSPESFSAEAVNPFPPLEVKRLQTLFKEVKEKIFITGSRGQKFSALHLNRDFTELPAIIVLGQWFTDVGDPDVKYAAFQQAAHNPSHQVLYIDMVAHGGSDRLTRSQRREAAVDGGVSRLAASQAQAAKSRLPETREAVVVGTSAGGMLAPYLVRKAGELDLQPQALIGFEIVGVDKRSSLGSAAAYLIDGHFGQRQYQHGPANLRLDMALSKFVLDLTSLGDPGKKYSLTEVYKQDPSLLAFLLARSPLATDHSFAAIEQTLDTYPNLQVALVSGGLSKVSRVRKIERQMWRLMSHYPDRVTWEVWPGDNHAMGIASQQPRLATFTRAVIGSLEAGSAPKT